MNHEIYANHVLLPNLLQLTSIVRPQGLMTYPDTCFHTLAIEIWGQVNTRSIENFSYVFGAICYKSAFILAELIKTKSDLLAVFRSFLCKIQLYSYKVHIIRIDNDSIFLGADFQAICREFDIVAQRSAPYRHHQLKRMER